MKYDSNQGTCKEMVGIIGLRIVEPGRPIEVEIIGNAYGKEVYVIIPGSGMVLQSMRPLGITILQRSPSAKVVLVNPGGHGQSEPVDDANDGSRYANDYLLLAKQLKKEGAERLILAGYSKGGCDLCKLAELMNEKQEERIVDSLVIIAGCAFFLENDPIRKLASSLTLETLAQKAEEIVQIAFSGSGTEDNVKQEIILRFFEQNSSVPLHEFLKDLKTATRLVSDLTRNTTIPMCFIVFANDHLVAPENSRRSFELLPEAIKQKSRIVVFEQTDHLDLFTRLECIAERITDS